jgi:hypothetical protein
VNGPQEPGLVILFVHAQLLETHQNVYVKAHKAKWHKFAEKHTLCSIAYVLYAGQKSESKYKTCKVVTLRVEPAAKGVSLVQLLKMEQLPPG